MHNSNVGEALASASGWRIDKAQCVGCGICIDVCPEKALTFDSDGLLPVVDNELCDKCGTCARECPTGAIEVRG